ncbi:uncharacterized protein N7477_008607 [Penicillium maclennaniae]|uniref:uncharacterized protein n=1 Tax=Penicillium maclennaniae TaxID=1343394 RepID=UPI00254099FF|nr:uncharacterized protein N7477_008607 [Penicillium maclennaniae]KAJ5666159.1 hypothetical protein N7477_008607 [Penicillium maclennaniae]
MTVAPAILATVAVAAIIYHFCYSLFFSSLARIPGPKSFAWTKLTIHALHAEYGPVVRVGPSEVTFSSTTAMRSIYGAGSGFERMSFYRMFEAYGRKNMVSFSTVREHGERKKLFAHSYAKSMMLKGDNAAMVLQKAKLFLDLLAREGPDSEIFSTLHYFSLDNITEFLYGNFGKTACLEGSKKDRELIGDIVDVARRKLSWYSVHFPGFTNWFYSRTGVMACIARQIYPMEAPTAYTAREASLIAKLWTHHYSNKEDGLDDLDIASEVKTTPEHHSLAGVDTTSDTLMFLIWSLSRPQNRVFQGKLIEEVCKIPTECLDANGIPRPVVCDKLLYVDAVIKETLRLFAPLPGSEPRSLSTATSINGYLIPPQTVVSISPYALHRNPDIFKDPLKFNPDRWMDMLKSDEAKKWFWAFSSGGPMCIGMHLAMAEMTTLVVALYRKYTTMTIDGFDDISPGITARNMNVESNLPLALE